MQWKLEDDNDQRVLTRTGWVDIEIYKTVDTLEKKVGVFIFADTNKEVKYIGKAGADKMIDEIYNALCKYKARDATLVKALYTNSDTNAQSLKTDLIKKYNPLNNR